MKYTNIIIYLIQITINTFLITCEKLEYIFKYYKIKRFINLVILRLLLIVQFYTQKNNIVRISTIFLVFKRNFEIDVLKNKVTIHKYKWEPNFYELKISKYRTFLKEPWIFMRKNKFSIPKILIYKTKCYIWKYKSNF